MGLEPNPIDLVSVQQVADWLATNAQPTPVTADDTDNIQLAITAFSSYVLKLTGRGPSDGSIPTASPFIAPVAYNEWYDGSGTVRQFLRNWPVQSVTALTIGPLTIPASTGWSVPGYVIDEGKRSLSLRGGGGYVNGILTVGFGSGGFGSYGNNGRGFCNNVFWDAPQNVNVQYTAGFSGVPIDLEQCALKVVAQTIRRRQWIGQKSQSMAQGAGTVSYTDLEMDKDDVRKIEFYRRNAIL